MVPCAKTGNGARSQVLQRELRDVLAADGEKAAALVEALADIEALQGVDEARDAELAELRDAGQLAQVRALTRGTLCPQTLLETCTIPATTFCSPPSGS